MPIGIYIDKQQNIFIADDANGALRKIESSTGIITTVAGNGIPGYSGDGGPATNAQIIPTGVFLNNSGDMFIADAGNNCIRKVYNPLGVSFDNLTITEVTIYPNPTTCKFIIETDANNNQSSVEIFDVVGKKVYESILNNKQTEVDISAQPAGIYMVQVTDAATGQRTVKKIVKE